MKIALSITSVLLFATGYWICEFFYPAQEQITQWLYLRFNLYAVLIMCCFWTALLKTQNKHEKFILSVGIGLSISDVIDRLWFNITTFTTEDVAMIAATLLISYLESYTRFTIAKLFKK